MSDIAELGFKVNTSDLDKAKVSLEKLKAASAGISSTSARVSKDVYLVAKANADSARAALTNMKATEGVTKEQLKQAREALRVANAEKTKAKAMLDAATAAKSLERAQRGLSTSSVEVSKHSSAAASVLDSQASGNVIPLPSVARDQMPNRFNTANIAAQFQDIGVTAAMGMSPMTIALQQGTQLSAIINSMSNPLKGIAEAFGSIINKTSLLAMGFAGLIAVIIQTVNWTAVAKSSLNMLADALVTIGPYALAAGAALSLIYAPSIISGLRSVVAGLYEIVTAEVLVTTAWASLPAVLAAILGAAAYYIFQFADKTIKGFRGTFNVVIGLFVGMVNSFGAILRGTDLSQAFMELLVTPVKAAFQVVITSINGYIKAINLVLSKMNSDTRLSLIEIPKAFEFTAKGLKGMGNTITNEIAKATDPKKDYVGKIGQTVGAGLEWASEKVRGFAQTIGVIPPEMEKAAKATKETKDEVYAFQEALDFTKSVAQGFFQDIANGLKQHKSLWETFSTAIVNALDKIFNKMIEAGVNDLFKGMTSNGSGDGIQSIIQGFLFNSKGNVFQNNGVQKFANGGAFTNGIYSSPTMFQFANGGSFGVMGEAGPEAVMPLHRGSDGSLGVKTSSANNNNAVVVNVNNYGNAQASVTRSQTAQGLQIDVMIDEAVSKKIGEQGSATSNALGAYSSRRLISR